MLKIYSAQWCPHCIKTIKYLENSHIEFEVIEIERQPDHIVQKVVDVNGGDDWVVPTLELSGKWREGKVFNEIELKADLIGLGVI